MNIFPLLSATLDRPGNLTASAFFSGRLDKRIEVGNSCPLKKKYFFNNESAIPDTFILGFRYELEY